MEKILLKLQSWSLFYRATFRRSLFATLILVGLSGAVNLLPVPALLHTFAWVFPTAGLAWDAAYRFLVRKHEFYYYHNATCSTLELYIVSFIISMIFGLSFYNLAMFVWKCI